MNLPVAGTPSLTRYPGGKGGAGVYHKVIGLMPPHEVYIEPFAGGGAVFRHKVPARTSVLIDIDARPARRWSTIADSSGPAGQVMARLPIADSGDAAGAGAPRVYAFQGDGVEYLAGQRFSGRELVYADPPYVLASRRGGPMYRHEMTDARHRQLLDALARLPCPFLLSGYRTAMYDDAADRHGWRRLDFQAMTRRGLATESVWMNFTPGDALHDYRYLGQDFRERERLKRKQTRWRARLAKMPVAEQRAMLEILLNLVPSP